MFGTGTETKLFRVGSQRFDLKGWSHVITRIYTSSHVVTLVWMDTDVSVEMMKIFAKNFHIYKLLY